MHSSAPSPASQEFCTPQMICLQKGNVPVASPLFLSPEGSPLGIPDLVSCPFKALGCDVMIHRNDMPAHHADFQAHASFFMAALVEQQKKIARHEKQIEDLQRGTAVWYVSLFNSCLCGKTNAWEQLKAVANCGDKTAAVYVMTIHHRGAPRVHGDSKKALRLALELLPWMLDKAKEGSHSHAIYGLAVCYEVGYGVIADKCEAVKWYMLAAELGNPAAQNNLGYCYNAGVGVAQDQAAAFRWYDLAATQGHATAQYNIGYCFKNGDGVCKNNAEAVKAWESAARQGYAAAQNNLGVCFSSGCGVAEDKEEALKWYRNAADQGHAGARSKVNRITKKRGQNTAALELPIEHAAATTAGSASAGI